MDHNKSDIPEAGRGMTRAERRKAEQRRLKLATPFFSALFLLFLVAFIIPLRPTVSQSEKRQLASFPAFSVSALMSGDYFDDITLWFSDTFPGREGWLSVSTSMGNLYGINANVVNVNKLGKADAIPDIVPTPAPTAEGSTQTPTPTPSAETPQPSAETPAPKENETMSVEDWAGINETQEEAIFGSALQIGDAAYEYFGFNEELFRARAELISSIASKLKSKDVQLYDLPIPSGVGVLVSPDYLDKLGCSQQGQVLNYLFSIENDDAVKVNAFNNLVAHNSEYIYFRTDHHWTALGAYYAYEQFCVAAGFEPVPLSEYTEMDMGDFLGSFYASSDAPGKLRTDDLIAYYPPGNISMKVYFEGGACYDDWPIVFDLSQGNKGGKYSCFIGGDNYLTVLTNNDLPDDAPSCAVIKDSYGNPFVIYLAQHYKNVYILDYRQYLLPISGFVDAYDVDDVIVAESLSLMQGEAAHQLFSIILQ